ncbi:hypothetical protein N431DRAFT_434803 [Stipitochalara longipes BDJ]|nr:hypothetical protein N431DRAFT_434803 [Stipitochalara longipes BDJ]
MAPQAPPPATPPFAFSPTLSSFDVSVKDYLATHPEIQHVVVGALVFAPGPENKCLILQRAATDFMPHLWETPGGGTDHHETVLEAAIRELREESGLLAKEVRRNVGEYEFVIEGEVWWKVSFDIEVHGVDVRLDEAEHQAFLWVSEEECRKGVAIRGERNIEMRWTSEAQLEVILKGFRLSGRNGVSL